MMAIPAGAEARDWVGKFLDPWEWLGLAAQLCFAGRFAYQWWKSEKAGTVVLPVLFWYLSIAGGVLMLVYAIRIGSLAIVVAQSTGLFFYLRNLFIASRKKSAAG
jgi:lipid-A-disaccharide synthase-like uncharacterized protein